MKFLEYNNHLMKTTQLKSRLLVIRQYTISMMLAEYEFVKKYTHTEREKIHKLGKVLWMGWHT